MSGLGISESRDLSFRSFRRLSRRRSGSRMRPLRDRGQGCRCYDRSASGDAGLDLDRGKYSGLAGGFADRCLVQGAIMRLGAS